MIFRVLITVQVVLVNKVTIKYTADFEKNKTTYADRFCKLIKSWDCVFLHMIQSTMRTKPEVKII